MVERQFASIALLAVVIVLALGACTFPGMELADPRTIEVKNETLVELTFKTVVNGEWYDIPQSTPLQPNGSMHVFSAAGYSEEHSLVLKNECTIGDVVAFGPNGEEVARHPPGLCFDDPHPAWVIQPSPGGTG
jgi:hypothetical protein